jgi:hypothetical protein
LYLSVSLVGKLWTREVVERTYDKLLAVGLSDIRTNQDKKPFVYVNYNFDIVYIEFWGQEEWDNEAIALFVGKAKHLAVRENYLLQERRHTWTILRPACKELESLTLVSTWELGS